MKRAILACLLLAGCMTTEERLAADDAQCRSYGTRPGDSAYIQCRMNLDTNRANIRASERFGSGDNLVGAIQRTMEK